LKTKEEIILLNENPFKKYKSKISMFSTAALATTLFTACSSEASGSETAPAVKGDEPEKTNVMYILLDDSGFSDLGSFGSEIDTPNIDELAENGLKYNNFHVTPLCSPTRASLMTGRNSHTVGMGTVANFDYGEDYPNRRGKIHDEAGMVSEILGEEGFANYAAGKWHMAPTSELSPAGPFDNWPLGKGFDRYYGNLEDSSDQFRPELYRDNSFVSVPDEEDYHYSEDIISNANQFITDHVSIKPDDPFFMYVGFGAQHAPHQVPQEYIDMYEGVYDEGWDVLREERFNTQKELGIIPEDAELAPRDPAVEPWEDLSGEQQEVYARLMETDAGMLMHTDEQVGKLMDRLEELGELDNTLIFLISDDGGSFSGGPDGTTNQSMAYNLILEGYDAIESKLDKIGGESTTSDYPFGWSQVSNTPFEGFKGSTHAGGIRTPMIVQWNDGIEHEGEIRNQFTHVSDITATVYDILGVEPPEEVNGVEQIDISGVSFAGTFNDREAETGKDTQHFENAGQRTIYHDGWKAVSDRDIEKSFEEDEWALYNMKEDFSEVNNTADENQEKVEDLIDIWYDEAEKYDVLPLTDEFFEAFSNTPGDNLRARKTFIYHPEMTHLSESAAPQTLDRNYTITIPFTVDEGNEGVLLAMGNDKSGYTIYLKNDTLTYEYHNGADRYQINSNQKLKEGENTVRFKFENTGTAQGTGTLIVNDENAGERDIEKLPTKTAFEGLDIGEDLLYPVSPAYEDKGTFPFTGEIEHVKYEFEEAAYTNIEHQNLDR
jgi:arylsulfatase A-like enzyme